MLSKIRPIGYKQLCTRFKRTFVEHKISYSINMSSTFNNALEQETYFYGILLDEGKFNFNKLFYKGELMLITDIDDDDIEESTQLATPGSDDTTEKALPSYLA